MARIPLDSLMGNNGPSYPEQIVAPYRKELVDAGFRHLFTAEEVDEVLEGNPDKIVLLVLNSVCGCSARVSRPGAIMSLLGEKAPDLFVTLFAGMEKDAVNYFRNKYLAGVTPSSPNILVFKNGQVISHLHRYQIETSSAHAIAGQLMEVFQQHATAALAEDQAVAIRSHLANTYAGL